MPHALSNDLTQEADLRARGGDVSATPDADRKANGDIDDDWSDYLDETSDMDAYEPRPARSERHDRGTVANKQADAASKTVRPTQRRIGYVVLMVVMAALIGGGTLAGVLTRQWDLLWAAMVLFVPFGILLLAPIWLAETTRIAQDETTRRQRQVAGRLNVMDDGPW